MLSLGEPAPPPTRKFSKSSPWGCLWRLNTRASLIKSLSVGQGVGLKVPTASSQGSFPWPPAPVPRLARSYQPPGISCMNKRCYCTKRHFCFRDAKGCRSCGLESGRRREECKYIYFSYTTGAANPTGALTLGWPFSVVPA